MGTLLLFGLLSLFSFVYAFFHFSDEKCSWASIFPQTKGKLKTWGVGNGRGVLLRLTDLLLFGWVSFLQSVLWPPEWNRSLPRDALCSFSLYSWEWDPLFACGVIGVLPCEPGIFCPACYSSVAGRMAEACGLMTLGGRLVGAGVAWVDEWGMNGDQSARVRGGGLKLKAMGAQRRELSNSNSV